MNKAVHRLRDVISGIGFEAVFSLGLIVWVGLVSFLVYLLTP